MTNEKSQLTAGQHRENYSNFMTSLINIRNEFAKIRELLYSKYPNWDKNQDARLSVFQKSEYILMSALLGMMHVQFHLSFKEWWDKNINNLSDLDKQLFVTEFDMFLKIGFMQFLFSAIESTFRLLVQAIDVTACNNGTAEFKSIYSFLFKRTNLKQYESLLDLLRNIRNSVHHNGIFCPRSGKNESITYKGVIYEFKVNKPIDCASWSFLISLVPDLKQMLFDIIEFSEISKIDHIIDPFHS